MVPVSLLIALTILTWRPAIYSVYAQPEDTSGDGAVDESHDQDYSDAA
jgi:hypothetical protein